MNIYKLRYDNEENALIDLKSKQVIDEYFNYINGTEAVVYVQNETSFDIDIMTNLEYNFGVSEVFPNTPNHTFMGWEQNLQDGNQ